MSSAIWIAVGAVAVLAVIWRVLAPSLDRAVNRAIKDQDSGPLIDAILRMGEGSQPDAFNHSIRRLWDDYQRELAIPVIRSLVENHSDEKIAQYWLDQVRGVEPELAKEAFDQEFIDAHYRPQVAATCGNAG